MDQVWGRKDEGKGDGSKAMGLPQLPLSYRPTGPCPNGYLQLQGLSSKHPPSRKLALNSHHFKSFINLQTQPKAGSKTRTVLGQ